MSTAYNDHIFMNLIARCKRNTVHANCYLDIFLIRRM